MEVVSSWLWSKEALYMPSESWRPRKAESAIHFQSEVLRTSSFNNPGQEKTHAQLKERGNFPSSIFKIFPIRALNSVDDAHPCWWRQIFYPQSTDSNANLFQKHHTNTAINNVLPVIWASLTLANQVDTIKLTIREMGELIRSLIYFHNKVQRIIINKKQSDTAQVFLKRKENKMKKKILIQHMGSWRKKTTRLVENTNYDRLNNICY